MILNEQRAQDQTPHLAAVGFTVPDAAASLHRAYDLGARSVYRRTHATEVELPAVAAPDGTHIFLSARSPRTAVGSPSSSTVKQ